MASPAPSHRASLLSSLRTGGVRSASMVGVPHTSAPGASFNIPSHYSTGIYNQQSVMEEEDQLSDLLSQNMAYQLPNTAAVDGGINRFSQQQGHFANGLARFQIQLMQLELIRMQALQAQQLQAGLLAQNRQQNGRQYVPPATAGPVTQSFDIRRPSQGELLRSQLSSKFGSRITPMLLGVTSPQQRPPVGALPLGASNNTVAPSKSDTAVSWRRGGNNNSVLSGNRAVSVNPGLTPSVRISPPPLETRVSPPSSTTEVSPIRTRPQPLRFTAATSLPLPTVAIDDADADDNLTESSSKSGSQSSPSTPNSGSSFDRPPLSPREEATKKLYEGLGIGRPVPVAPAVPTALPQRVLSQPVRQPRGPPSGADELGPRNFATRIRRKAIGGLGALMDARERRDVIEAY
ncbi:hypothetical protein EDB89DRAFT_2111199 [Lactarius sanguifluus]|nr:hypothetical protein EDB89DRAFT_2111199 [Lactarius sanguifluus]